MMIAIDLGEIQRIWSNNEVTNVHIALKGNVESGEIQTVVL